MKIDKVSLQIAMARASMNISDLAEVAGLSKNTIAAYISGNRNPTTKNLGILANALKCDVLELILKYKEVHNVNSTEINH